MPTDSLEQEIKKYALQNAVFYKGTANEKAVLGKIIAQYKKKGVSPQQIIQLTKQIITEINKLSLDQQKQHLECIAPELLKKEKKERTFTLPSLPDATENHVITRFPPEPNGYLHIGHAKAAIIDYKYAQMYHGKFILRFDDTNPENAKKEFYDAQKQDLLWLGIKWDEEYHTSDNLPKHYTLAEQLISQGDAYICSCEANTIKNNRYNKRPCACRTQTTQNNLDQWQDMLSDPKNKNILRLKADIQSNNTAMRDPTLFRIINSSHPKHGTKYHVWPTYDFAGAIEDSLSGVTHPFRTKEYELRDETYYFILDRLQLRKPHLMEFARLSIEGMPVSKRKIKPLIEQNLVHGYDDIRLPTLKALKKRGIQAEAIEQFVLSQGISKVESTVSFEIVESYNKKLLDNTTKRYFFVPNPIKLKIQNAPNIRKTIPFHPSNKELGGRVIVTSNIFYIPTEDFNQMKTGEIFRLKDLYNIKIVSKKPVFIGEYAGGELISETRKIQWCTDKFTSFTLFIPYLLFHNNKFNPDSLKKIAGKAEEAVADIPTDTVVQFERVGFARIENNEQPTGFFSHK